MHAEDTVRTKTSVRRTTRKRDVGESAGVRSDLFPYSAKGSTGMMVLHATATNKQSPLQEFQLVSGLGCEDGFPQFVRKLPVNPGVLATLLRAILIFKLLSGPSSVGIRFRSSWWPSISSLLTAFAAQAAVLAPALVQGLQGQPGLLQGVVRELFDTCSSTAICRATSGQAKQVWRAQILHTNTLVSNSDNAAPGEHGSNELQHCLLNFW